jgi:hypothetical protein
MRKMIFALAAGLALFGGTSAWAQSLDFTVPGLNPGASISYAGGATDLVASNITITTVQGLGTPLNNLVITALTNGLLNFTSGAFAGVVGTEWTFGGGGAGSITISATGPASVLPSPLLTGQILNAQVTGSGGGFHVAIAAFVNTIGTGLASLYGVPTTGWSGNLNIGFTTPDGPVAPAAFNSSLVSSGDVLCTVPEPSTMAIAGLGGLGLIGYGLRRRKAMGA